VKKKYWIIIAVSLVVVSGLIWFFFFKKPKIEYKDHTIGKGKIILKVLATGTVQPENRLQIKSSISGRAESVLVKEGQKVYKGQVLLWMSSTERAVMLDSARAAGAEELKKWEEIYKPTPVVAPLPGTVILRNIEPGQTFSTSDAVLVMADRLTIQAQVDETDLAQIHVGQKVKVTLDAFLDKEMDAKVHQVAYEAKTVNNVTTYIVDVLPDEKLEFLRSGMTANVTFFGDTKENILVIPNEFIKYVSGNAKVSVKTEKKPEEREVELGITDGKLTEIKSGLTEGEVVLLEKEKDAKVKKNMFSIRGSGGRRQ
jgi:macrolide-specific efflux system membrane fusion protein